MRYRQALGALIRALDATAHLRKLAHLARLLGWKVNDSALVQDQAIHFTRWAVVVTTHNARNRRVCT